MGSEDKQSKPNKLSDIFTDSARSYKRGSFDYQKNQNLVIEMLLNNMKIEGQEVDKNFFLKYLDEQNTSK
jgi:hypothetical protein